MPKTRTLPQGPAGPEVHDIGIEAEAAQAAGQAVERPPSPIAWLATTYHSFLGSFSAVSKRNFATKYAFFQVFRDLQNYLADFLKKLQNFAKNRKILQFFLRNFRINHFCKKSADFCENR